MLDAMTNTAKGGKGGWRNDPSNFRNGPILNGGVQNLASCWYQTGHSVSRLEMIKFCSVMTHCMALTAAARIPATTDGW